jgi:hypothetical protein
MIYRASTNARPSRPVVAVANHTPTKAVSGGPVIETKYEMQSLDSLMEPDATVVFEAVPSQSDRRIRITAFATMAGVAVVTFVVAAILVFVTVHSVYSYFA